MSENTPFPTMIRASSFTPNLPQRIATR